MKVCCLSDIHGHFPEIPDCDILLLGGDYCPVMRGQHFWFNKEFKPWIANIAKRGIAVFGVAGNHDWMFVNEKDCIPRMDWTYLEDSGTEYQDYNIYGSPWQKPFYDWAFNMPEEQMARKWELIPDNTDILVLHGPPYGIGDFAPVGKEHTGSPSLLNRISVINPKLVVFGHIHAGFGIYHLNNTILVNASYVNEKYAPTNDPVLIEL